MITPVYNSALAAGDKITDVFAKLQSLFRVRLLRSIATSPVSGGASTTADVTIQTLTIPANQLLPGDVFDIEIRGKWTKPNAGGSSISFWVKSDTVKIVTVTYTSVTSVTALPFVFRARVTVRAIGAAGVLVGAGDMKLSTTATAVTNVLSGGVSDTRNTTASFNISAGFGFSNSNASNNVTANVSYIRQG